MLTFLNLYLDNKVDKNLLIKHLYFSVAWIMFILITIFRIDLTLMKVLPQDYQWLSYLVPLIFFLIIVISIYSLKWYYKIVLILYPLLFIFWFLPKIILKNGKIYLLLLYIKSLISTFSKFKKVVINTIIFFLSLTIIVYVDNLWIRIPAILAISYYYGTYVLIYMKNIFKPDQIFESEKFKSFIDSFSSEALSTKIIKDIEEEKPEPNLSEDELCVIRLEKILFYQIIYKLILTKLIGPKGKTAFLISLIFQISIFTFISIIFFTFLNFQLYLINSSNFLLIRDPSIISFISYTVKSITLSSFDIIKPHSDAAIFIELISYAVLGVFLISIASSFKYKNSFNSFEKQINILSEVIDVHIANIDHHITNKYDAEILETIYRSEKYKEVSVYTRKIVDIVF